MKKQSKIQLLKNIANSALVPTRIPTMLKMIWNERVHDDDSINKEENLRWLNENKVSFESLAKASAPALWEETEEFYKNFKTSSAETISRVENRLGYHLGGGGYYPLLFFVTRKLQPDVIVETGVATGYSSQAFLKAIAANEKGKLYSSDFPYFRLKDPEKYIGILVDDELRSDWSLYIEGDEKNLQTIFGLVDTIDVFHYDSDKSYGGRQWAVSLAEDKMDKDSFLIMDDIQDNSFFFDFVAKKEKEEWMIFEFEKKFVGIAGPIRKLI